MKIAVLIRRFITTGGAERYAVEVTRRLAENHELHVFAQEWTQAGNERIIFHKIPKFFTTPRFLNTLVFAFFSQRAIDDSFDIIHSHERVVKFDVLTIHCPCFKNALRYKQQSLWKKSLFWLSVALSPRKLAYFWLEKQQFTVNKRRVLLAVSQQVKANIQSNYALPDDCFGLAYPGVNSNFSHHQQAERASTRAELGIAENELAILFVGTEFKRKGLDALLKAFALLPSAHHKLLVAGGGDVTRYSLLADELGIKDSVIFLGLVTHVERLYAAADIFILPTLADPAAMSPLEAMASGVATVMSSPIYNGCAEHICNGEALILTDPQNPQEIADTLMRLNNESYRHDLAKRGQQLARQITWENTTAQTLAAYAKMLQQRM